MLVYNFVVELKNQFLHMEGHNGSGTGADFTFFQISILRKIWENSLDLVKGVEYEKT